MKVRRDIDADEDCEPVIVPRNDEALVAVAPERVRRLREHLVGTLREMRTAKPWVQSVSPALPDPTGFPARVAQTACSLCKGWCCRNGDDNGFLDEPTLARLCIAPPGMTEGAILRLYLARVPPVAYRDSASFTANRVARRIGRFAPTFATSISAAVPLRLPALVVVISPLLANCYFRRFLLACHHHGHRDQLDAHVVNYADDLVICCRPGDTQRQR